MGLLIAIVTFGMVSTSGGYYLLVTQFGTDMTFDKIMQYRERGTPERIEKSHKMPEIDIKIDTESIKRGKTIFNDDCSFCHDAFTKDIIVGPGLKGVLKSPYLPVSKSPATPENIKIQLTQPFNKMPSFEHFSDEEIEDIIAFLNSL